MLDSGHIKLHRSILNWEWYDDVNVWRVFTHLLLTANWKEQKWHGNTIERGQRLISRESLAKQTGLSIQQVRTALNKLKSTGEVTIRTTNKNTLITINNYDRYQYTNQQINQQSTSNQPDSNQQVTTNEESKKARNKEKTLPPIVPHEHKPQKQNYAEFVRMTNDEYSSLVAKLGEVGTQRCVEILDNYKGAKGKSYKSDYRAILNWVVDRYKQEGGASSHEQTRNPLINTTRL